MDVRKIILCGKGSLCVAIFQWLLSHPSRYQVVGFVPALEPEGILHDWDVAEKELIDLCEKHQITIAETGFLQQALDNVMEIEPSQLEVQLCFYKKIIPVTELRRVKRVINIHLSDLPKYRGSRGINWALKNNERFQGVSIHQVDEKLDRGPIFGQMKFEIFPEVMEVIDVYKQCLEHAFVLHKNIFPLIDLVKPRAQLESDASYYSSADFHKLGDRLSFTRSEV